MDDVLLGQFAAGSFYDGGEVKTEPSYLEDETVPEGSRCPTFAMACLHLSGWMARASRR